MFKAVCYDRVTLSMFQNTKSRMKNDYKPLIWAKFWFNYLRKTRKMSLFYLLLLIFIIFCRVYVVTSSYFCLGMCHRPSYIRQLSWDLTSTCYGFLKSNFRYASFQGGGWWKLTKNDFVPILFKIDLELLGSIYFKEMKSDFACHNYFLDK